MTPTPGPAPGAPPPAAPGAPAAPAAPAGIGPADRLLPAVYEQLRRAAQKALAGERRGHTLQATALVHEAYLRLGEAGVAWSGPAAFYTAAAEAMRRILIEHARARGRVKRGGDGARPAARMPLGVFDLADSADADTIVSLDEVFRRLEQQDAELAMIVRLRFYAGLSVEQTAAALNLSPATVKRRWTFARAWIFDRLDPTE